MELNDIVTKNFESYADVAADIVNALLHEGTVVVTGDEMLTAATESLYADSTNTLHNQLEDVAKYHVTGGMPRALYLFANQMKVDKGMILRKAGYIGGEYRRQYEKQNHGLYPVIELVLYWGMARWKASSDMRIVLDYLAEGNAYRSDRKVIHKEATIKMLRVLSGDKNVDDTEEILKGLDIAEEDEISMCELFDQYTRRGKEEGMRGIIITCKEFNINYDDTMLKLRKNLNISESEAIEGMKKFW